MCISLTTTKELFVWNGFFGDYNVTLLIKVLVLTYINQQVLWIKTR